MKHSFLMKRKTSQEKRIADQRISQYKPVPVAYDVDIDKIQYIKEHQEEFTGVDAVPLPIRRYPQGNVAPHVIGYVGEINDVELGKRKNGYQLGEIIGKSGIELAYEKELRGTPAKSKVQVDKNGSVLKTVSYTPPIPGDDIILSLDVDIQKNAEQSLADQIDLTRKVQDKNTKDKFETFKAPSGSVTFIDPNTGKVKAIRR